MYTQYILFPVVLLQANAKAMFDTKNTFYSLVSEKLIATPKTNITVSFDPPQSRVLCSALSVYTLHRYPQTQLIDIYIIKHKI